MDFPYSEESLSENHYNEEEMIQNGQTSKVNIRIGNIISTALTLSFSFKPQELEHKSHCECNISSTSMINDVFKPRTMDLEKTLYGNSHIKSVIPLALDIVGSYSSCPIFMTLKCMHPNTTNWNCNGLFSNDSSRNGKAMFFVNAFQNNTSKQTLFDYSEYIESAFFQHYGCITDEDVKYEPDEDRNYLWVVEGKLLHTQLMIPMAEKQDEIVTQNINGIQMIKFEKVRVLEMIAAICSNLPPLKLLRLTHDMKFILSPLYDNIADQRNYAWGNSYQDSKMKPCTVTISILIHFIYQTNKVL